MCSVRTQTTKSSLHMLFQWSAQSRCIKIHRLWVCLLTGRVIVGRGGSGPARRQYKYCQRRSYPSFRRPYILFAGTQPSHARTLRLQSRTSVGLLPCGSSGVRRNEQADSEHAALHHNWQGWCAERLEGLSVGGQHRSPGGVLLRNEAKRVWAYPKPVYQYTGFGPIRV